MSAEEEAALASARQVCAKLHEAGCIALIAGGWVRDRFLGRPARDIDIATSGSAAQIQSLFKRTVELPRSTWRLQHGGEWFEVTSFRGIKREADLQSASLDAEMRDFTVNALFYDPLANTVIDFVGGVPDVQRRTLRLCVDPEARLMEDPIRVLRGVRFAVTLGLKLAPDTARAMQALAHRCSVEEGIPPRRLWLELHKLNQADAQQPGTWAAAMKLAHHLGLLRAMLPWITGNEERVVGLASKLAPGVPLELRLAAMLHPDSTRDTHHQLLPLFRDAEERERILRVAELRDLLAADDQDDARWAAFYASDHSALCLEVMTVWMPPVLVPAFLAHHRERAKQLAAAGLSPQRQVGAAHAQGAGLHGGPGRLRSRQPNSESERQRQEVLGMVHAFRSEQPRMSDVTDASGRGHAVAQRQPSACDGSAAIPISDAEELREAFVGAPRQPEPV